LPETAWLHRVIGLSSTYSLSFSFDRKFFLSL
jgi:hypothetical protein